MTDLKIPEKRYRPEIEGLRTIATLLVAVYHIWLGRVSGGIDVFFVLSGFLITTSLLSRVERNGKIGFGQFILGLAKRLFPQALIVTLTVAVVSIFLIPKVQWEQIISHMFASTMYFENWRLAIDAVDYLARDEAASPFQHYWSLSIQGQFYLLWPALIFIAYFLARKIFKTPVRKTLLAVLSTVFVLSISYSIFKTYSNQPWAYFDTFARVWEFSIGGMFALLLPYLSFNKRLSTITGWVGILVICLTGILLPVSTVFPGFLALVPISGALLVLVASENSTRFGIDKFLSLKPFPFLGSLTYGFYLWHWPLLIFYQTYMEQTKVSLAHGLLILLATFVLSFLSTKIVENPIRHLNTKTAKRKLLVVLSLFLLPVFLTNFAINQYVTNEKSQATGDYATQDYPGALMLTEGIAPTEGVELMPSLLNLKADVPAFYQQKECLGKDQTDVKICSFGVTENPDTVIALVGGSHSGHWMPTLEVLAEELNFQIDLYNHDGCRFTNSDPDNHLTDTCLDWNKNVIKALQENPPDLVFTTSTLNKRDKIPAGYIGQWQQLEGYTTVFAIRDNPRMLEDVPTCLEKAKDMRDCAVPRSEALSDVLPWENTEGLPSNVIYADLSDNFCDENSCYPVIGNILVYRDTNHITKTFAKTLAPALKKPLQEAFESLND
ncbi:MAG: acyltransferase family protein [Lysinibacillus sp.]